MLHVLGLEDVFFSPQDQTVTEGDGVFLQCVSGESSPSASISWLKDGKAVTRGKQIQVSSNGLVCLIYLAFLLVTLGVFSECTNI